MHRRLMTVVCLAAVALIGPLAGVGSAARVAALSSASYVDGQSLTLTGYVTCPAGHFFAMQAVVTQKSGAVGAQTTEESCTGTRQLFTLDVHNISDVPFSPGRITTDLYGGSFCFIDGCSDQNLADHLKQKFRI